MDTFIYKELKFLIDQINLSIAFTLIMGVSTVFISFYLYYTKRKADKHLAELLKLDVEFQREFKKKLEKINFTNHETLSEYKNIIDINSEIDWKLYEIKKQALDIETQLLKLEIIKQEFDKLSTSLKEQERKEILEALNQLTKAGQINYINDILIQSGITENIKLPEK